MVNASILVGLLILLTFSSVSSPFGQTEQSEFFAAWYEAKLELKTVDQMLYDCNTFLPDSETGSSQLTSSFTDNSLWNIDEAPNMNMESGREKTKGSDVDEILNNAIFDKWNGIYEEKIIEQCKTLPIERYNLTKQIMVLNSWGEEFNYLRNDNGKMVESKYHLDLASGPFLTNMVNLGMMFPFLISAIVEVITNSKTKKDDDQATKTGKTLMAIGFVSMVVGLSIIAYSFYEASFPYLQ